MRLLVTGSDGYIGQGVVNQLLDMGNEVVAFGLDSCKIVHPKLEEHVGNIFSISTADIRSIQADAVLHLAWRNGFKHNDPTHINDLPLHFSFIQHCADAGIKKVACMGTMHEVGYHEGPVSETTPCWPTTTYAIAKNSLRELVRSVCNDNSCSYIWLRGYYLVSSDGRGESIFSKIVAAAKRGEKYFPFTSGVNKYDFLDYQDFCRLTAEAVCQDDILGIINICSGKPQSLAERVEQFIIDNDFDIKLQYGAFPDRPYDSPAIWGDSSKIDKIDAEYCNRGLI